MDLAFLGMAKIEVFLLTLVRTASIFTAAPLFGSRQVPVQVRIVVALGIALALVPLCSAGQNRLLASDTLSMSLLIVKEIIVGLVVGFITAMVFAAIQMAGDLIDMHAGFSFATMLDPTMGAPSAIAARFHHLLAGTLFFVTNSHHILLQGLADSFRLVPVDRILLNPSVAGGMVDMFVVLFGVALRIAAPVVAAVFLADISLVIMARVVPQMNVLMVGFPLKLGVGIVGMLVALPVAVALCGNAFGDIGRHTTAMLRLLAAP